MSVWPEIIAAIRPAVVVGTMTTSSGVSPAAARAARFIRSMKPPGALDSPTFLPRRSLSVLIESRAIIITGSFGAVS